MGSPRIVSLLPAATEILFALGLDAFMVGRSHECDYPVACQQLPVCSYSRLKSQPADSNAIHREIATLIQQALAIYEVDLRLLQQLQPTHIITQHQCSVCAVSPSDLDHALSQWLGHKPQIVSLSPFKLRDIFDDILKIGHLFNVYFQAEDLVGEFWKRMNYISALGKDSSQKPSVGCIEWTEPLMAAGYWVPQLVARAGGRDLFGEEGAHAAHLTMERLHAENPEVVIAMPCGYNLAQTTSAIEILSQHPLWNQLDAVRNGCVYLTDGHQFFNRPGPRMVQSLEIMAEILHPDLFHFEHEGNGWLRFSKT